MGMGISSGKELKGFKDDEIGFSRDAEHTVTDTCSTGHGCRDGCYALGLGFLLMML